MRWEPSLPLQLCQLQRDPHLNQGVSSKHCPWRQLKTKFGLIHQTSAISPINTPSGFRILWTSLNKPGRSLIQCMARQEVTKSTELSANGSSAPSRSIVSRSIVRPSGSGASANIPGLSSIAVSLPTDSDIRCLTSKIQKSKSYFDEEPGDPSPPTAKVNCHLHPPRNIKHPVCHPVAHLQAEGFFLRIRGAYSPSMYSWY